MVRPHCLLIQCLIIHRLIIRLATIILLACASHLSFAADLQQAITEFNNRDYVRAKHLFESATKETIYKNDVLYYLGRIAYESGDAEQAKEYLGKSVEIEPNLSDEYYWLGRAYGDLAQKANVLKQASYASSVHKYFQLATEKDPKNIKAQRGLFAFYIMAPGIMGGGIDKAERTLADIRVLSPIEADIEQLHIFIKKKDKEKHLAHTQYLVKTYPQSADALFSAAHSFRNHKQLDEAIKNFEAASKLPVSTQNKMFVENASFHFGETCQWANVRLDDAIASVEQYLLIKVAEKNAELTWPRWTLAKLYHQKADMGKYQTLRKQLDPDFIKREGWMGEDIEAFDKQNKK